MLPFKEIFTEGKSVLILGFGKEGRSSYHFMRKHFPGCKTAIADRNKAIAHEGLPVSLHLGEDYLKAICDYDLVIKSPGISLGDLPESSKSKITSQTDLFLRFYGKQTIGITGTKGKSTTASLIFHLLNKTGRKATLMGNIGLPAFDFIEKIDTGEHIVYELSAHQLETTHSSPHIAVLLNLYPEHLDYFGSFEKYRQAKLNIFRFQQPGDSAFCGEAIQDAVRYCKTAKDLLQHLNHAELLQRAGLKGKHNLENVLLAFQVLQKLGIPFADLPEALSGFQALPHRMEYVGNFGGVTFYNDSISTVPQSAVAAVNSIAGVDTLILGGFDRGLDYTRFVDFLEKSGIKNFFFLGKAGERMFQLFQLRNTHKNLMPVKSLQEVFRRLKQLPDLSCCLLSPAAASYDQFHNFEHRGDLFKKLAVGFGKEETSVELKPKPYTKNR